MIPNRMGGEELVYQGFKVPKVSNFHERDSGNLEAL
jgi:hypothetical protein